MKKQLIRLTESDLHKIIEKTVLDYINEGVNECGLGEGEKLDKFKKYGKYALGGAAAATALGGASALEQDNFEREREGNEMRQQADHNFEQERQMDDYRTARPFGESKRRKGAKITEGMLRKIVNQSIKNVLG